jgi:hypothetical protein
MTRDFPAGNYRFIPAVFQYSSGAAADSGFEIERVRFDRMPSLAEGFARIAKHIQAEGRPLTSFCACELRSPSAFTEDGFLKFNQHYVKTLAEWGLFDGTINPVARSNVCPEKSIRPLSRRFMHSPLRAQARPRRRHLSSPAAPNRGRDLAAIQSVPCATATSAPMA